MLAEPSKNGCKIPLKNARDLNNSLPETFIKRVAKPLANLSNKSFWTSHNVFYRTICGSSVGEPLFLQQRNVQNRVKQQIPVCIRVYRCVFYSVCFLIRILGHRAYFRVYPCIFGSPCVITCASILHHAYFRRVYFCVPSQNTWSWRPKDTHENLSSMLANTEVKRQQKYTRRLVC